MGRLFLDAGTILYLGPGAGADRHAHHAVQLVWSERDSISVTFDGATVQRRAVMIPAHEPHSLEADGSSIALLLVEPHGTRGARLDQRARRELAQEQIDALAALPFPAASITPGEARRWCEQVLTSLGVSPHAKELSSVSRRALELIEQTRVGVPRLGSAAAAIGLSPTRLTHVFTAEVGMPFRRYVLWNRIKRAVMAFQETGDLTSAAIAAGFSDAAHFSRTFRAMFGLSPSLILPLAEVVGTI